MKGLELFENHKAPVVVLSGGKIARPDISEAKYMSNVIAESSAEPVPMLLEEYSNNTYENIYNSKLLIPQAKSIVVVTDEFHIARSVLLAKRAGFAHVTWASPEDSYFPTAQLWFYYVREFVAMVHYLPKFIFG
jgi:vancomycin permeability regulator SanA